MPNAWKEISNIEIDNMEGALRLLQDTLEGYDGLSVEIMQRKMRPGAKPPTRLFCLRLFSFADDGDPANYEEPLVSAFFFLRRIHAPSDLQPWAFCMTAGALPDTGGEGGLGSAGLIDVLKDICKKMRRLAGTAYLEVMHAKPRPIFKVPGCNLEQAYDTAIGAGGQLQSKGRTIPVHDPWADPGQPQDLIWWNINEN